VRRDLRLGLPTHIYEWTVEVTLGLIKIKFRSVRSDQGGRTDTQSTVTNNAHASLMTAADPMGIVDGYPAGYPRFSFLLATQKCFQVVRRFARVRPRFLVQKQKELSELEEQLDKVDREDPRRLFLGNRRRGINLVGKSTWTLSF